MTRRMCIGLDMPLVQYLIYMQAPPATNIRHLLTGKMPDKTSKYHYKKKQLRFEQHSFPTQKYIIQAQLMKPDRKKVKEPLYC